MQFIIDFKDTCSSQEINGYCAQNGLTIKSTFNSFTNTFVVEGAQPPMADMIESIVNDSAEPIQLLSTVSFSTEGADDWWKIAVSASPDFSASTQTVERKGANSTVYIIDSGIKADHPEFINATVTNLYSFNGDFTDYNGHGTAIASVISGETCGLTAAKLKAVKIFQSGVPTLQSHILAALDAVAADIQANQNTFPVINMSWSIAKNEFIENKIRLVIAAGAYAVAAAGNSGTVIENVTPASMAEVFTVGAFNANLEPCNFSNYSGPVSTTLGATNSGQLDGWAPGENIRAALLNGSTGNISGTSIAAGIQSAAFAYNVLTFSDGSVPRVVLESTQMLYIESSGKPDILSLTGVYVGSPNLVTIFTTVKEGDHGVTFPFKSAIALTVTGDENFEGLFFSPLITADCTFNPPLPSWININNGWMRASASFQQPQLHTGTFTYTKYSGEVVVGPYTIAYIPTGGSVESAGFDPEIQVTLTASCGVVLSGGWYNCSGTCIGAASCVNMCPGGLTKVPEDLQCGCAPPYQLCAL